jgi:hypothetical protein
VWKGHSFRSNTPEVNDHCADFQKENKMIKCPKCGSKRVKQRIRNFFAITSNKSLKRQPNGVR